MSIEETFKKMDLYYMATSDVGKPREPLRGIKQILKAGWGPEVGTTQSKEEIITFFEEVGCGKKEAERNFTSLVKDGFIKQIGC